MSSLYVDTNFLVRLFIDIDEFIMVKNKLKNKEIYTSSLTYDELIWAIRKFLGKESSINVGDFFLNLDFLKILELNRETLVISNETMKEFDLKPRDSLHYATMKQKHIKTIVTNDKDFEKIKNINIINVEEFIKKL